MTDKPEAAETTENQPEPTPLSESVAPAEAAASPVQGVVRQPPTQEDAAKKRRANQTTINLLIALAACLAVVIVWLLFVPHDNSSKVSPTDYKSIAADSQSTAGSFKLSVPSLDKSWWSNNADYQEDQVNQVNYWYIGFITPGEHFIGLTQAKNPNPTWVIQQLSNRSQTGNTTIDGTQFKVYDQRNDPDFQKGKNNYALVGEYHGYTLIFNGIAPDDQYQTLVKATLASLR